MNDDGPAPLSESEATGREIMRAVVGALVGISAVVIALVGVRFGMDALLMRIPRFALTCLLAFYLYRGGLVARFLTVVLSVVGASTSLVDSFTAELVVC